jgi:hypothetical protein
VTNAEIILRKACVEDYPALLALFRSSLVARGSRHYTRAQLAGLFADIDSLPLAMVRTGTYLVAEMGGRIVAGGGWMSRGGEGDDLGAARPASLMATIQGLFATEDRAGRLLVGKILDRIEAEAKRRGRATEIEVSATLADVALFARRGYAAREPLHLDLSNGVFFEVICMKKRLFAQAPAASARRLPFVLSHAHRRDAA